MHLMCTLLFGNSCQFIRETFTDGKPHVSFCCWYGHVLRKEDNGWVKKCMEYVVEGSRPRGRAKRTWIEVVQRDCKARD